MIAAEPTWRWNAQVVVGKWIQTQWTDGCGRHRIRRHCHQMLLTVGESRVAIRGEMGVTVLKPVSVATEGRKRSSSLWLHPSHTVSELGYHINGIFHEVEWSLQICFGSLRDVD